MIMAIDIGCSEENYTLIITSLDIRKTEGFAYNVRSLDDWNIMKCTYRRRLCV